MGLFLFALIFSGTTWAQNSADLIARAESGRWWEDRQWLRLVQYQKSLIGNYKSPAESPNFFLSPEGKTHPDRELLATIQALQDGQRKIRSKDGRFEDPVACVFPARKIWLEKISGVKLPSPACERFDRFKEILQPQSLTYVFSSYYLNNPASAFGHTFLRINKAPSSRDGERYELSDYGVGYAAMKVSDNPFVYSFLGVSGLMPGSFDINPYYYKVREYNDFESRDLWEYDLNFTPEEVDMVVAYIWELLNANFNYHYFSENCSYRILSIFEAVRPSLDLTSQLKAQVMPADTVQTLYRVPGLVKDIHYRPSVRATFETRYHSLSEKNQKHIRRFARDESLQNLKKDLSVEDQRDVLDAAIDYLDFRYPKEILRKEGHYAFKKDVLLNRAELGGASEILKVPAPWNEAPHDAQGSRRWGLGAREWNKKKYYLLDVKLALHDLLDPKLGYPPTAEITMGAFSLSFNQDSHELALDKATVYEVVSLSPVDDFNRGFSWRLKFSVERGYENACTGLCRWTELSGGSGITKTLWSDLDLSLWLRATGETSPDFVGEEWRIGAGPSVSLRWNRGFFALLAESYYRYDYKGVSHEFRQNSVGVNISFNKSFSLRVEGRDDNSLQRVDGRLLYYY